MGCAFTDASSTRSGSGRCDCRAASGPVASIGCTCCVADHETMRCTRCYAKFQREILRRIPALEATMHGQVVRRPELNALVRRPELNALLEIDFGALAVGQLDEHAEAHLVKITDGVWRWRGRCPSCWWRLDGRGIGRGMGRGHASRVVPRSS